MSKINVYHVRCQTCGRSLAHLAQKYEKNISEGKSIEDSLDELNINKKRRYCCRLYIVNPTFVLKDEENRAVVEGLIDVNTYSSKILKVDNITQILKSEKVNASKTEFFDSSPSKIGMVNPKATIQNSRKSKGIEIPQDVDYHNSPMLVNIPAISNSGYNKSKLVSVTSSMLREDENNKKTTRLQTSYLAR